MGKLCQLYNVILRAFDGVVYWVSRTGYGLYVPVTQHAVRCAILSCGLYGSKHFFFSHYIINGTIFEKIND
jgi:hypothetical protein